MNRPKRIKKDVNALRNVSNIEALTGALKDAVNDFRAEAKNKKSYSVEKLNVINDVAVAIRGMVGNIKGEDNEQTN